MAFCEIDPFCHQVLNNHWPDVPVFKDVRDMKGDEFGQIDLICGGYPCQPFSLAGRRRGAEDDRHLWPEVHRLVASIRPAWCLFENVAGHISMGLDQVLSDLEGEGYASWPVVIPACAVDAPHRRDRVWIIAHDDREQRGADEGKPDTGANWRNDTGGVCENVANAGCNTERPGKTVDWGKAKRSKSDAYASDCGEDVSDADNAGLQKRQGEDAKGEGSNVRPVLERVIRWLPEPGFCQFSHGLPEGLAGRRLTKPVSHCMMCIEGMVQHGKNEETRSGQDMQGVWSADVSQEDERASGGQGGVRQEGVLQPTVYGGGTDARRANSRGPTKKGGALAGESVPGVRDTGQAQRPSHRHEPSEQRGWESDDAMRVLSHIMALEPRETSGITVDRCKALFRLRQGMAEIEIGNVPKTLSEVQEIWRSADDETKHWWSLRVATGSPFCAEWPNTPRVASGVSKRVDRLRGLGNAVVPQIPEIIGRAILMAENQTSINAKDQP